MIRLLFLSLVSLLSLSLMAQPKKKKVVFIIADGIPTDLLEKAKTPQLDEIWGRDGYSHAYVGGERGGYSQSPTISAVGYNSLLTGVWANKHNVWDNDIKEPNYHYPTIFRFLKQLDSTKKTAVFSTWKDNRTRLIGEGLAATGKIRVDYHGDGFELDTVAYPHDKESRYVHRIDDTVTALADRCIREEAPDLTWLYLEYTDDMGHRYGNGPEMKQAIGYMDKQVGLIWNAVQYRQQHFPEDWLVIVTTDHGRDSITGRNHGGQSDRERTTWIVTNAKDLNRYHRDYTPAIVDILPTIARFMGLVIPRENSMELDGTSLIGKVSIANPVIQYDNGKLDIRWKAFEKDGNLKIWLTTTNNFKTGGKDDYKLLAELPVSQQSAVLGIGSMPSSFYKIVLEAPLNTVNRWIVVK
ncbi:MAG TPA: alkaline phosphatase family protein [Puia sp.]|jgi:predicted AlkP superfamily pyrophosphatase or phosphodiesterase